MNKRNTKENNVISCLIDETLLVNFKKVVKQNKKFIKGAVEEALILWLQENKGN